VAAQTTLVDGTILVTARGGIIALVVDGIVPLVAKIYFAHPWVVPRTLDGDQNQHPAAILVEV